MLAYASWRLFFVCAHPSLLRVHVMGTIFELFSFLFFLFLSFYHCLQFTILKFLKTEKDPKEYVDVGLRSWLQGELDDDMRGETYWPPENKPAMNLIKTQQDFDPTWKVYPIEVLRFYNTFKEAREAAPKFWEDSQYDTEADNLERGRGKRKKGKSRILESSSSEDEMVHKKSKKTAPAPPPISRASTSGVAKKGRSVVSVADHKKAKRDALMETLRIARQKAAAKMVQPGVSKSPGKGMTSPWKVSTIPRDMEVVSPAKSVEMVVSPANSVIVTPAKSETGDLSDWFSDTPKVKDKDNTSHQGDCDSKNSPVVSEQSVIPNPFSGVTASLTESTENLSKSNNIKGRRNLFHTDDSKSMEDRLKLVETIVNRTSVSVLEVSGKCDLMLMNIGRLHRAVMPREKRISIPPSQSALPLASRDQLNKFETFLGASDVNLAATCDYMSSHVVTTVVDPERKSASKILKALLANRLAQEMNLDGGHNKIAFRSLNLYKVFQGSLQTAFPQSDLAIADNALQKWLKDAKWRKQGPVARTSTAATSSAAA